MRPVHYVTSEAIGIREIREILREKKMLTLSRESEERVEQCRNFLEGKIAMGEDAIYGINTGFGALCDIRISEEELEELQQNLVRSHAAGTGPEVPLEIIRIMLILKIHSLALGYSGIRKETLEKLAGFFNYDILPVIYQQGSLGASGDLAPLAHLSLPLIGQGEVYANGRRMPAVNALSQLFWKPLKLGAKEGLALLNGTQFSAAYSVWCLIQMEQLWKVVNMTASLSLEAFNCRQSPFIEQLQRIRAHEGQLQTAADIRRWRDESEMAHKDKFHVQDPYAFRCVPQVHGATFDTWQHIKRVTETEVNSVTDNPVFFPDDDLVVSGGNFHAQPLALALDFFAIALAELGNISERRSFQLLSGARGLPTFLTPQPGLHSGLMIAQYTAASIVSQNKQFCTPASVDSITSSNGQEDHVSMAANAATKTYQVVENIWNVLSIEFLIAAQAMDFRRPSRTSPALEEILEQYRKVVPTLEQDRVISQDIGKTNDFLRKIEIG